MSGNGVSGTGGSIDERFHMVRRLVEEAGDSPRFRPDPVPRELVEDILEIATGRYAGRYQEQPWRFLVVVGEERERILLRVADALGRRWGLGAVRPRGLASEAVLRAPALLLVFSKVPSSEGLDAVNHVALATQNVVLLCAAAGLATHRIFGTNLVPEAVLDWAGSLLGPEIRSGEFVSMIAVGYPEAPAPPPGGGTRGEWIGVPDAPPLLQPLLVPPPATPAAVLRSPGGERVILADPYDYNREQIAGLLRVADYTVEAYADGQSLLARLDRPGEPVHLYIISDNLPDTSGFELVRALRQRAGGPVPLIVTTARRDAAFRIGGLAAGVDYYLRKPVNPIELYTATRILLEQHRRGEELARANDELSRLLVELRAAQARLVQQAKMASLGQLVAGVAHEVNTPLGAVVSNNDLFVRCFRRLRKRVDELGLDQDPGVSRDLNAVSELIEVTRMACERIMNIVRELRVFARLDEADRKAVDLHEGLESTLVLINHLIKGRVEVRREYGKLPPVECHPNQINQVFMNLLVNACQAMGEGGMITLRTAHDPEGRRVMVQIGDTGAGIPRDVLGRIFDPGFTTKGAGVGTGLGLSICYQIVEAHGGEIVVESQVGRGTTFTIWLPEAPEGATG
jgi:signal transduction histidine kinase/nitroreductase